MPHANIQYSQLRPERRAWVMHHCYEALFDLVDQKGYRIAFEASGKTVDELAAQAPSVLQKMNALIRAGQLEPVSSPYIHFMMSNVPPEIGLHSLRRARDTWERHTGVRPAVGWNPECGWASYIPELYKEAGFETLVMDADSLFLSFPEIREATGLAYDVQGHSNKNELFRIEEYISGRPEYLKYLTNPSVAPNGLKMLFRSDFLANPLLWYLMGATEGNRAQPVQLDEVRALFARWHQAVEETGSFLMPYAEDAEYIGSSAYFYVKQFNEARFFEPEPESVSRFAEIADSALAAGYTMALPSEVIADAKTEIPNSDIFRIDNGAAWHGGTAKAWTNTSYSRIMDPVCLWMLQGLQSILRTPASGGEAEAEEAMCLLESAWVSDARWPPEPTSPGRFNVREALDDLYAANRLIGKCMEKRALGQNRSLYSPQLMETQLRTIEQELMARKYFGE